MGNRGKKKTSKALPTGDTSWVAEGLGTFVWDEATGSYVTPAGYRDPTADNDDDDSEDADVRSNLRRGESGKADKKKGTPKGRSQGSHERGGHESDDDGAGSNGTRRGRQVSFASQDKVVTLPSTRSSTAATSSDHRSLVSNLFKKAAELRTILLASPVADADDCRRILDELVRCVSVVENSVAVGSDSSTAALADRAMAKLARDARECVSACIVGMGSIDLSPHAAAVKTVCPLDGIYYATRYAGMIAAAGYEASCPVPDPVTYHNSTSPFSPGSSRRKEFEVAWKAFRHKFLAGDFSANLKEAWRGDAMKNPLLDLFKARWMETLMYLYQSGLVAPSSEEDLAAADSNGTGKKKRRRIAATGEEGGFAGLDRLDAPLCDSAISSVWRDACREWSCHLYAFAVPNAAALSTLCSLGPIVEVGAGTGYWAKMLRDRGADIIALDRDPPPMTIRKGTNPNDGSSSGAMTSSRTKRKFSVQDVQKARHRNVININSGKNNDNNGSNDDDDDDDDDDDKKSKSEKENGKKKQGSDDDSDDDTDGDDSDSNGGDGKNETDEAPAKKKKRSGSRGAKRTAMKQKHAGDGHNPSAARAAPVRAEPVIPDTPANEWHGFSPGHTAVSQGSVDLAARYPTRALFLCYPSPGTDMAVRALRAHGGRTVAYVGEWGGQTADRRFEEALLSEFSLVKRVPLPNWADTAYELTVWERVTTDFNGDGTNRMNSSGKSKNKKNTRVPFACTSCGTTRKTAIGVFRLRRCRWCRNVWYCGSECAEKDEARHRADHAMRLVFDPHPLKWGSDADFANVRIPVTN